MQLGIRYLRDCFSSQLTETNGHSSGADEKEVNAVKTIQKSYFWVNKLPYSYIQASGGLVLGCDEKGFYAAEIFFGVDADGVVGGGFYVDGDVVFEEAELFQALGLFEHAWG